MDSDEQVRRWGLRVGVVVLMLAGAISAFRWWTRPPAVAFDNLRYVQLLWTAVSSRNPEWVGRVHQVVQERQAAGEMSDAEFAHFQSVIETAQAGDWDTANRDCFEFAEAQLSRRRAEPGETEHEHHHQHAEAPLAN